MVINYHDRHGICDQICHIPATHPPLGAAPTKTHTPSIDLITISIRRRLRSRELLRSRLAVRIVIRAVQVRHLVQDAASHVIVVVGAGTGELGEAPEAVVGAGDDGVGAGDGVQQGAAVGAVAVGVGAGDGGRGGLDVLDVVVDGAHLGLLGGGPEPGGEVVRRRAGGRVGGAGHGDGVGDAGLEGVGLRGGAGVVGDGAPGDARGGCSC